MKKYSDIIKAPIVTEKTASIAQGSNTVVLSVDP